MGLCFAAKYFAIRRNLLTSGEEVKLLGLQGYRTFPVFEVVVYLQGKMGLELNDLAISACILLGHSPFYFNTLCNSEIVVGWSPDKSYERMK